MAVDLEVKGFTGSYASVNAAKAAIPVELPELVNKAITVGGVVKGSSRQRSLRRSSIANMVLSSVHTGGSHGPGAALKVTRLYERTETTEKSGISFRLGMALASVVAGRVLDTKILKHVSGTSRRADLVGLDGKRRRHVVEAKSRTYGIDKEVRKEGKAQARATAGAYIAGGTPIATASVSLADLSQSPISVLLEDPRADEDATPRAFDEAAFIYEYYSPVRDLLETKTPEETGVPEVDRNAIGAWLPGGAAWLGVLKPIIEAGFQPTDLGVVEPLALGDEHDASMVSATADGHVLLLDPRIASNENPMA